MHSISTSKMSFVLKILANFVDGMNMSSKWINRCVYGLTTITAFSTVILSLFYWCIFLNSQYGIFYLFYIYWVLVARNQKIEDSDETFRLTGIWIIYTISSHQGSHMHIHKLSSIWMFAEISFMFFINSIRKLL